jgi:O-acetyl-ADP-ribose deacetylase (regulator of RNase III)
VTDVNGAAAAVGFVVDDLARARCHAIVNPAGESFALSPTGVNRALADAGGPDYERECEQLKHVKDALVWPTGAGRLDARFVLHAVVPVRLPGHAREDALRDLHDRVLELASALGCRSVALPAFGWDLRGFPPEWAAGVVVPAVERSLDRLPRLRSVHFVFREQRILEAYYEHSSAYKASTSYVRRWRAEIAEHLRRDGDTELAEVVAALEDGPALSAIEQTASRLNGELSDMYNSSSVSLAALYAEAARLALRIRPA